MLLEGTEPGGKTEIFGWFGTDVRAFHDGHSRSLDGSGICICIGASNGDEEFEDTIVDLVDADAGVAIITGPRLLDGINMSVGPGQAETRLVKPGELGVPSDLDHLALFVEAQERSSSSEHESHTINWDADVVILAGPSPELLVGADGRIVRAINVGVNGGFIPVPGSMVVGDVNVDDLINDDPGDVVMRATGTNGSITGGQLINGHHWGTFEFRDNWETVFIENLSTKHLIINNIEVINQDEDPIVDLASSSVTVDFAVERVVVPTLMEIENRSASELRINGTVDNPIGDTLVQNDVGPILATHSRDVAGSDGRVSLVRSNILHLESGGSSIGTSSIRLNIDTVAWKGNSRPVQPADRWRDPPDLVLRDRHVAGPQVTPA